nr:NAD-dependent epimerase/dehydratase family protein [Flavobacterium sp.]
MRVLITGATGLIGTQLQSRLIAENFEINYLTTQTDFDDMPGTKGFYWNPAKGKIDQNCMLGVDVIVHLAGASISKRWTQSYKQEIIESRILSANLLFKTLKNNPHNVRQLISASAIGIYPNSLSHVFSENETAIDNSFLGDVVAKWEQSVDKFKPLGIKV